MNMFERNDIPGGTETILLVEDEDMLLTLLQTIVEERGYRALTARDGEEAVTVYAQHRDEIALVLTDMGLPKLGGWEVFGKIREINPRARVILASGYLDQNLRTELMGAGAVEYLQKPYVADVMLRKIREVIDS